jgi:hypothetical protein
MDLRRGFQRLALAATGFWLVVWTFAYVLNPTEARGAVSSFSELAARFTDWRVLIPCLAVAASLMVWVFLGFDNRRG